MSALGADARWRVAASSPSHGIAATLPGSFHGGGTSLDELRARYGLNVQAHSAHGQHTPLWADMVKPSASERFDVTAKQRPRRSTDTRTPAGGADGASSVGPRSRRASESTSSRHFAYKGSSTSNAHGAADVILQGLAKKLEAAEEELKQKDKRIAELGASLKRSQDMSKEVLSARQATKEAVEEMAEQNAKLIRAYMEKKKQVKEVQKGVMDMTKAEKQVERLEDENHELKKANIRLQQRVADLASELKALRASNAGGVPSPSENPPGMKSHLRVGVQETSNKAGKAPERPLTPKSIRIMSLEDDNRRLLEENASLKDEQAAILSRAVQRDKIDHHRHMGNVAFQEQHYEEALRHYNSAIEIDGSEDNVSAVLYSNRGACNFYLARYMDCIYDCTLSMSYDPSYHRSYQRRAEAHAVLGDYVHAIKDLDELQRMTGRTSSMSQVSSSFLERSRQGKPVNHYKVLGLEPTATEQDIRTAFKQMALKYHPDRATISSEKAVAEHIFKLVSEASRVLGEPSSRAEFDKLCL